MAEFSRTSVPESELAELVYAELRQLAARYMRRERKNHTLQPTALVNETWTRLGAGPGVNLQNKTHFLAIASLCMRQVLVDHARRRHADRRGGTEHYQVGLEEGLVSEQKDVIDLFALNELLDRLKTFDERACRIVEMRFFGGLSFEEIADLLKISSRTVTRDWNMARAWLHSELANTR